MSIISEMIVIGTVFACRHGYESNGLVAFSWIDISAVLTFSIGITNYTHTPSGIFVPLK
jgi:hypothetical protein